MIPMPDVARVMKKQLPTWDLHPTPMGNGKKKVPIGKIKATGPGVFLFNQNEGGTRRDAAVGGVVNLGDTVVTGNFVHSRVTIQFNDNTEMFLCENAFVIFNKS
jgi:hypothetical protein